MTTGASAGRPTTTHRTWYRGRRDNPEPSTPAKPGKSPRGRGAGTVWTGLTISAIIALLLLVFILQNTERARVQLFFWHFSMPIGVGILLAAVGGGIIMTIIGALRIWQLHRTARRS